MPGKTSVQQQVNVGKFVPGITAGKTQHSLCTQQQQYRVASEDRHRRCDLDLPTQKLTVSRTHRGTFVRQVW